MIKILSIDGGGIKGLIPAQILYRIEKEFSVNIHDYFDVFTGTSAGSMIIAAIVYGKATGSDIVNKLLTNTEAKGMMQQGYTDKFFNIIQVGPKYNGKKKRDLITRNVGEHLLKDTTKQVVIPTYNISLQKTRFFKSWDPTSYDTNVIDIVDASSAAPAYFPGIKIQDDYYIDGGVSVNNPTDSIYADILAMNKNSGKRVKILSLGTGLSKRKDKQNIMMWGGIQWAVIGNIMSVLMDAPEQIVDYRTQRFSDYLGHDYLRINDYIENTSMDDTSDENLAVLRKIGDEWFDKNIDKIRNFLIE